MAVVVYVIGGLGLLGALLVAALLIANKPVPPWLGALPVVAPLTVAVVAVRFGLGTALGHAAEAPPELASALTDRGLAEAMAPARFVDLVVGVPALVLLLGAAVAGMAREPRRWALGGIGLAVAGVVALAPLTMLLVGPQELLRYGVLSWTWLLPVFVLGLLAVPAAIAQLGGGRSGPEAAATAGVAILCTATALYVAGLARNHTQIHDAAGSASPEMVTSLLASGQTLTLPLATGAWAVLLAAMAFAALSFAHVAAQESSGRRISGLLALVLLVPAPLALLAIDPVPTRLDATAQLRDRLMPPQGWLEHVVADATEPMLPSTAMSLTRSEVLVGHDSVADLGGAEAPAALRERLTAVAQARGQFVARLGRSADDPPGPLLVHVHRELPFGVVRPLLQAAADAGWSPLQLVVEGPWGAPTVIPVRLPTTEPAAGVVVSGQGLRLYDRGLPPGKRRHMLPATGYVDHPCAPPCSTRGEYDLEGFLLLLDELKTEVNEVEWIELKATAEVPWSVVVAVLDMAREQPDARDYWEDPKPLFPHAELGPVVDPATLDPPKEPDGG